MELDTLEIVRPAHLWVPPHTSSAGEEAAEFGETCGITLDPEQRLALDTILAEDESGKWAAFEAAVIASRQNLKTFLFQVVALADLFLFGAELTIWTAHLFPTANEALRNMKTTIESYPHLIRRVKRISEANGEEGFELFGGQRILFKARSKSGGRGLTGDRVILDEAFALAPSEMGSLLPTLSARPNPQVLYGSSAGLASSDVLRNIRDRGRAGGDPSLAYLEWCAPVVPCADERCDHRPPFEGCALDNIEAWRMANPAMGRRISQNHIAAERRALPPAEFARERMGWWDEPEGASAGIPAPLWEPALTEAIPGATLALAADVTPDFAWASIGRASVGPNGAVIVDLVERRRGTQWVADALNGLLATARCRVVVDAGGPASVLLSDLESAGIVPLLTSAGDVAKACGALIDGLLRRSVLHLLQADLEMAVAGASRRPMGEAWAWSRKSSATDISPLVAITLALWGSTGPDEGEPHVW